MKVANALKVAEAVEKAALCFPSPTTAECFIDAVVSNLCQQFPDLIFWRVGRVAVRVASKSMPQSLLPDSKLSGSAIGSKER